MGKNKAASPASRAMGLGHVPSSGKKTKRHLVSCTYCLFGIQFLQEQNLTYYMPPKRVARKTDGFCGIMKT
jgi:hypothetical protein